MEAGPQQSSLSQESMLTNLVSGHYLGLANHGYLPESVSL